MYLIVNKLLIVAKGLQNHQLLSQGPILDYCYIDLFADDATYHTHGKTKAEIEPNLQHDGNTNTEFQYLG